MSFDFGHLRNRSGCHVEVSYMVEYEGAWEDSLQRIIA